MGKQGSLENLRPEEKSRRLEEIDELTDKKFLEQTNYEEGIP